MLQLPLAPSSRPAVPNSPPTPAGRFAFVSLGCPKNTVDSEKMLGHLATSGYQLQPGADGADVVVINTCAFIESARQESLGVIREMLDLKKQGRVGSVVVAGCLAERNRDLLLSEVPEVDQIVGVFGRDDISSAVDRAVRQITEQRTVFRPAPVRALDDSARIRITPRHYAYLKISEGCDRLCTYCAIPKMRGKHATKPMESILAEARELAADGVRELIIVAQDTTYYGMDLYGETRLAELLTKLNDVPGIEWIRVLYAYPEHVGDDLLDVLAGASKIVPYIDMPLQHIADGVLKRMVRRVNRAQTCDIIDRLRDAIPDLVMRTTFITGFPGETEADFLELQDFLAAAKFERCGVFAYSLEPNTPAAKLGGHLPEPEKQARLDSLMRVQQAVAFGFAESLVGSELPVIIDGVDPEFAGHYQGRTYADSPDIDCAVRVKAKKLRPGDFVSVKITAADGYDLIARALGQAW